MYKPSGMHLFHKLPALGNRAFCARSAGKILAPERPFILDTLEPEGYNGKRLRDSLESSRHKTSYIMFLHTTSVCELPAKTEYAMPKSRIMEQSARLVYFMRMF
jgi:hypothetical protein